jgi:hypothetical protein
MDFQAAHQIAVEHAERLAAESGLSLALFERATLERDFGWVFFYGSESRDELLAGNAPFIVDRRDGSVHMTGTACPLEEYLDDYARLRRV